MQSPGATLLLRSRVMPPGARLPLGTGVLLLLAACGGKDARPSVVALPAMDLDAGAPAPAIASTADVDAALASLTPYTVQAGKVARRVLYTWTTDDQITELRRNPTLLVRAESPVHGQAHVHALLDELAANKDEAAALLRTEPFRRARFAWPSAFAVAMGWTGESYGERLVRVVLKPDAIFAVVRAEDGKAEPIRFVDAEDRPITLAQAKAQQERVAAIYFEHVAARVEAPGTYREYVLSNEAMIESWSVGGDDERAALDAEVEVLDRLATLLRHAPTAPAAKPSDVWRASAEPRTVADAWAASLSLTSDAYRLSGEAVGAIAGKLRARPKEAQPLAVRPSVKFVRPLAVPAPVVRMKNVPYKGSPLYTFAVPPRKKP